MHLSMSGWHANENFYSKSRELNYGLNKSRYTPKRGMEVTNMQTSLFKLGRQGNPILISNFMSLIIVALTVWFVCCKYVHACSVMSNFLQPHGQVMDTSDSLEAQNATWEEDMELRRDENLVGCLPGSSVPGIF